MVLYAATKNQGKIKEINKIMERAGIICKYFPDMEDVEETGSTFEENAKIKADFFSSKLKMNMLLQMIQVYLWMH